MLEAVTGEGTFIQHSQCSLKPLHLKQQPVKTCVLVAAGGLERRLLSDRMGAGLLVHAIMQLELGVSVDEQYLAL